MCRASLPVKPADVSSARTSSSGRSIPGGRCPSGVASGRVTSSGTTFGCVRANWRKSRATVRSWPAQSGSVVSTDSCASTISATPSSTAALLGTCRDKIDPDSPTSDTSRGDMAAGQDPPRIPKAG